jgi:hypothetical protein
MVYVGRHCGTDHTQDAVDAVEAPILDAFASLLTSLMLRDGFATTIVPAMLSFDTFVGSGKRRSPASYRLRQQVASVVIPITLHARL